MGTKGKSKILLVDDDSRVIASISSSLAKEGYFVTAYSDTNEAAATVKGEDFDVVLTDIQMPEIKGIDLLEKIHRINPQLPVILMTAYPDRSLENMVMEKTQELGLERRQTEGISRDLIGCLTKVAEFGDDEAKAHGTRVGLFSELISKSLGMPLDFVRNIRISSQLHDIGKIGITDNILLKPGSLTTEELEIVKTHTTEGRKLLTGSLHPALKMAESIALNHHERWNGTGYPEGLKMEDIPLEGRIVMIADQYDVIRTRKPYKSASGHEEAFKIITEGDGRTSPEHFDPQVLDAFIEVSPKLDELYNAY
jgi:putative two-component system response regulator